MKCRNSYLILNDNVVMLTITKKNGKKRRFFLDAWEWSEVSEYQWHCTSRGYCKTSNQGNTLSLPEVINYPRFKSENAVWHHINGLKDDNRKINLDHVPWWYNVLMNQNRKHKPSINGIFKTKSGSYRVRDEKNRLRTFQDMNQAMLFRYRTLRKKGLDDADAKRLMGILTRRQYDSEYCQRLLYGDLCT